MTKAELPPPQPGNIRCPRCNREFEEWEWYAKEMTMVGSSVVCSKCGKK